jgi:hypothetical protein
MGIRVLISDSEACIPCPVKRLPSGTLTKASTERASFIGEQIENPGGAYLAARKAHYAQQEKFNKQAKEVIEQYCAAFSGLFVKCETEFPSVFNPQSAIRNPVLSLYFLVQREHVERFQQVFREIKVQESPKLLLSGPWPPYNFVQPDHIDSQESIFPSPFEQRGFCDFYEGITTKSRRR